MKTKVKVIREKDGKEVSRMDIIGQNGNDGLHYDKLGKPMLKDNPISFIMEKYPETAKMFQDMQFEQWELLCKKQKDYGPKNISVVTNLETEEDVFTVKEDATKGQIRTAFKKFSKGKLENRMMLSKFVDMVAA